MSAREPWEGTVKEYQIVLLDRYGRPIERMRRQGTWEQTRRYAAGLLWSEQRRSGAPFVYGIHLIPGKTIGRTEGLSFTEARDRKKTERTGRGRKPRRGRGQGRDAQEPRWIVYDSDRSDRVVARHATRWEARDDAAERNRRSRSMRFSYGPEYALESAF